MRISRLTDFTFPGRSCLFPSGRVTTSPPSYSITSRGTLRLFQRAPLNGLEVDVLEVGKSGLE